MRRDDEGTHNRPNEEPDDFADRPNAKTDDAYLETYRS
jgi:hypothetical protein